MRKQYHYTLGFPKNLVLPNGLFPLRYSYHALERAREQDIWLHRLPAFLDTGHGVPVDVELTDGVLTAVACRQFWTKTTHLVIVCQPTENPWLVRSVYLNHANDRHETLNPSIYSIPE